MAIALQDFIDCCRSGRGGDGEMATEGQGRWVDNHKYRHNSGLKKRIWLPASDPADGQHGSDVVIVADPEVRSWLQAFSAAPGMIWRLMLSPVHKFHATHPLSCR